MVIAPSTMVVYRGNNDQIYVFSVKGTTASRIWSTAIYTNDSSISTTVLHSALVVDVLRVKVKLWVGSKGVQAGESSLLESLTKRAKKYSTTSKDSNILDSLHK